MTVYPLSATFARGELSPRLHARSDTEHYAMALATARNWIVMRQGGIRRRPGFSFINQLRDMSEKGRLVEFEFNEEQAYALLFNDSKIRFFTLGSIVVLTPQNITGITQASTAVVTYSGADTYANGNRIIIDGVVGMTEVNGREFEVANVNTGSNTFELSGVNSSGYTAYSSGGTVSEIYEIDSPYLEADIFELQFAQAGDTVYIAHPEYAPRKLVRSSETSWTLSEIAFEDGPYLEEDERGTYFTAASTGAVHPIMSGLTTPSGTVANDDSDADAWEIFDVAANTDSVLSGVPGWWSYDLASTTTKIADAYWIQTSDSTAEADQAPTAWKFEGYDGSNWIVLDQRNGETGWAPGERRYFEFVNETGYQSYRLYVIANDGDGAGAGAIRIAELGIHETGDSQTPFNLTASSITGINDGAGFKTTDVGRTIRLMGTDNVWRWARIAAYTSTTVVTIRLYGHALPDLSPIARWQLSSWSVDEGYPSCVGFFEDRLALGGSVTQPRTVWASRSAEFESHGTSDPAQDNDGIAVTMTGGRFNKITFLEELADLAIGTGGSMRIMGPSDSSEPFSNTNIRQKQQTTTGSAAQQPLVIGSTLIYADRYKKHIHEFAYSFDLNGYQSKELSILSDHLFRSQVVEAAFQDGEDDIAWYVIGDGSLVALTYEAAQQIAGMTPVYVAGGGTGDAVVESVASIPSSGGAALYAVVKRTIDGGTVRYVEVLNRFYESGDDVEDAVYFDSALSYSGSATGTVTGAHHLRGETVGILADGVDIGDATVSATGSVTLPGSATAAKIALGKRYTSRAVTLRMPQSGNRDGSALSRKMHVIAARVDMLETAGLMVGTQVSTRAVPRADEAAAAGALNTGMFDVLTTDKHRNNGVVVMTTDRGYPATVRALMLELEGEP